MKVNLEDLRLGIDQNMDVVVGVPQKEPDESGMHPIDEKLSHDVTDEFYQLVQYVIAQKTAEIAVEASKKELKASGIKPPEHFKLKPTED